MVDIELFKNILENKDSRYIGSEDYVSKELIQLFLKSGKMSQIVNLFKQSIRKSDNTFAHHRVWCICVKCLKQYDIMIHKTDLLKYVSDFKKSANQYYDYEGGDSLPYAGKELAKYNDQCFICKECIDEKKKEKEEKERKEKTENSKMTTEQYIELYLSEDRVWGKDVKSYNKIKYLQPYYNDGVDFEMIKGYIISLSYQDFMNTLFWKTISAHVKYKAIFKCQLCKAKDGLRTHHNSYERHGEEQLYWKEDLICICNDCHRKHHEIKG